MVSRSNPLANGARRCWWPFARWREPAGGSPDRGRRRLGIVVSSGRSDGPGDGELLLVRRAVVGADELQGAVATAQDLRDWQDIPSQSGVVDAAAPPAGESSDGQDAGSSCRAPGSPAAALAKQRSTPGVGGGGAWAVGRGVVVALGERSSAGPQPGCSPAGQHDWRPRLGNSKGAEAELPGTKVAAKEGCGGLATDAEVVERRGFEPLTSAVRGQRSAS